MEREEKFSQTALSRQSRLLTDSVHTLTLDGAAFSNLLLNCFAECPQETTEGQVFYKPATEQQDAAVWKVTVST